jgi:serine/threonine protein kinase
MAINELVGTSEWLVGELCRSYLMEPDQVEPLVGDFLRENPYADATAVAEHLVSLGLLTSYQTDRIILGEVKALLLGPYVLCEPIGTGSMGTVFRAIGKADKQPYAVKVLPLRSIWNVRMARRQVRAFVDLPAHPAIVPFVDVGTAMNKHYLVWPLAEGKTLDSIVKEKGALPWAEAARIALRLVEGLQLCHRHGLFHGLIKPSNIMLGANGAVRVLDFGIGALLAENTDESLLDTMSTANATAGMLDCASPESILDPARRSYAGDQYSLGCSLYFVLTGRYPYPADNMVDKMMAHQMMTPESIHDLSPGVPPEFIKLVERLMQKVPEARFRQIGEALHELNVLAERSGISLQPPSAEAPETPVRGGRFDDTPALSRASSPSLPELPAIPLTPPDSTPAAAPPQSKALPPLPIAAPAPPPLSTIPTAAPIVVSLAATPEKPTIQGPSSPAPVRESVFSRVLGKLAFWRTQRDLVQVSALAPPALVRNQTINLSIFAHCDTAENILAMGRTYFPSHQVVATFPLRREIARGSRLTFHLALPGIAVEQPVQKFVWRGQTMPLPYSVKVPADCRPGEIVGIVSIGEGADIIANMEFQVRIAAE